MVASVAHQAAGCRQTRETDRSRAAGGAPQREDLRSVRIKLASGITMRRCSAACAKVAKRVSISRSLPAFRT